MHRASLKVSALVLVAMASLWTVAEAARDGITEPGIPMPAIARAEGGKCVENTDFMRRNHMDLLKHQRDETMLEGVRGKPYSLKDCLDCHVVSGPDAVPVTALNPQHFCRSCHDYAAVNIDCFQCHASRPGDMSNNGTVR